MSSAPDAAPVIRATPGKSVILEEIQVLRVGYRSGSPQLLALQNASGPLQGLRATLLLEKTAQIGDRKLDVGEDRRLRGGRKWLLSPHRLPISSYLTSGTHYQGLLRSLSEVSHVVYEPC